MSNKTYDILKFIAQLILPLASFISALAEIWGFAYGVEIAATLTALDTFAGFVLRAASKKYYENSVDAE